MIEHVFAGVAVADYGSALQWYERVLGRAPDVIVRDDIESMWQLRDGAWIYIVQDADRAGKSLLTILVDNLDRHLRELSERGIEGWELETEPGLFSKATLIDRDGNALAFGQNLQAL